VRVQTDDDGEAPFQVGSQTDVRSAVYVTLKTSHDDLTAACPDAAAIAARTR
jgi:hypothetical protein